MHICSRQLAKSIVMYSDVDISTNKKEHTKEQIGIERLTPSPGELYLDNQQKNSEWQHRGVKRGVRQIHLFKQKEQ